MRRGVVVAAVLLAALPGCLAARLLETPWPEPSEPHAVVTRDGWTLEVHRVRPPGTPRGRPVVVMHGIVANGRNMDLDERHSIARWLAARGRDVWVPSLRGTSGPERLAVLDARATYDFDTYVTEDVVAIVEHVRRVTGAAEVDWVGHSMGGMLAYAHLARGGSFGRLVTLGSPVRLRWGGRLEALAKTFSGLAAFGGWLPMRPFVEGTVPAQLVFDTPMDNFLTSPENVDGDTWRRFLAVGVNEIPGPLLEQMAGWLQRDRFDSRDHAIDYLDALARVTVPTLVVAGRIDGIAPPWAVRPAFDRLAGEKAWLVAGEANGMRADYNHMDLVLGKRAPREIFPVVLRFLERGDPVSDAGSDRPDGVH